MTARVLEMVNLFLRKTMEGGWDAGDREDLVETLVKQGHNPSDINAALSIVEKIQQRLDFPYTGVQHSLGENFFIYLEEFHVPLEVRGYLSQLVKLGVIDPIQREDLVERILLMEPEDVTIEEVEDLLEDMLSSQKKSPGHFDETISDFYH